MDDTTMILVIVLVYVMMTKSCKLNEGFGHMAGTQTLCVDGKRCPTKTEALNYIEKNI